MTRWWWAIPQAAIERMFNTIRRAQARRPVLFGAVAVVALAVELAAIYTTGPRR